MTTEFSFLQNAAGPETKLHVIYLGNHKEYYDNITVIPLVEALKTLKTILQ